MLLAKVSIPCSPVIVNVRQRCKVILRQKLWPKVTFMERNPCSDVAKEAELSKCSSTNHCGKSRRLARRVRTTLQDPLRDLWRAACIKVRQALAERCTCARRFAGGVSCHRAMATWRRRKAVDCVAAPCRSPQVDTSGTSGCKFRGNSSGRTTPCTGFAGPGDCGTSIVWC